MRVWANLSWRKKLPKLKPNRASSRSWIRRWRDGEQTYNVAFAASEKLQVARLLLEKANVNYIEVASARACRRASLKACVRLRSGLKKPGGKKLLERIEILGFVDEKRSVGWMVEAGALTLNMLTKGSLNHLKNQLKKTPTEHFGDIARTIDYAVKQGRRVNVYLEDWSNGYLHSPAYMYEYLDFIVQQPVGRIMLPDTLGVLYPSQVFTAIFRNHDALSQESL